MFGRIRFTHISVVAALLMFGAFGALAQDGDTVSTATADIVAPGDEYKTVPISLDVQEAEIGTVLRSLAGFSGTNIVASPRVQGKVTVKLEDVPWEEALAVILKAHSFGYVEEQGIYRIDTSEELRKEELDIQRARKQVEDLAILNLGMVNLHYANAEETKDALEEMLTERGNIDVDVRTNSLIINDVQERVALIMDMATDLDTKTPQVEINARLIDLDSKATRELGVSWGVANPQSGGVDAITGELNFNKLGITNPIQNPAGAMQVGVVQDWGSVMAKVEALEVANKAHLISNPIITTTDNREAKILVGQKIPLIVSDEAGNAITQLTTVGIMLMVTPHINKDNQITLDVHNEVSDLSAQATVQGGVIINTSESDTRVLVENGETAIIAGLIRSIDGKLESGIPLLMDIPLLGGLFKHTTNTKVSRELVIFVTPTIVSAEYMQRDQIIEGSEIIYDPAEVSNVKLN
ncbi:MAG: type IV pilus secretin PilQ [Candidatus Krumholzibacteria bacterium]|nr:type IV pilus secretin PilQ [Candidatus Krumholzibacteria bacterium]